MTFEEFKTGVNDFVDTYATEYSSEVYVTFENDTDGERYLADIKVIDQFGEEWLVPVCCGHGDDGIIISDDPDIWSMTLDGAGFYTYLFIEAGERAHDLRGEVCQLEIILWKRMLEGI